MAKKYIIKVKSGITTLDGSPVDVRHKLWESREDALAGIDSLKKIPGYVGNPRYIGLTVPVIENNETVEYWFKDGIVDDSFIRKNALVYLPVVGEYIQGVINNLNQIFTTGYPFIKNTTAIYLNGVRLVRGVGKGYVESDVNKITFDTPPLIGDEIIIDYFRLS